MTDEELAAIEEAIGRGAAWGFEVEATTTTLRALVAEVKRLRVSVGLLAAEVDNCDDAGHHIQPLTDRPTFPTHTHLVPAKPGGELLVVPHCGFGVLTPLGGAKADGEGATGPAQDASGPRKDPA